MRYTTLYFDLDNTLLDFSSAESSAINKLLKLIGIEPSADYVKTYSIINSKFWGRFERGEINREDIFEGRFIEFTKAIGIKTDTAKMSKDYFTFLSEGHNVISGAKEVLEYVKNKGYTVCVTTNGVAETQHKRIEDSGLKRYFDYIIISEDTGHKKPEKEYFDYALCHTPEKDKSKILVIGDSQSSDILGGKSSGMDTCWLNPHGKTPEHIPTYTIKNIKELMQIL